MKYFAIKESPVLTPVLSPAQIAFNQNSKGIIQNIFREHTARRCANGLAHKVLERTVKPIGPLGVFTTSKISIPSLIRWSCLGIGVTGITLYVGLLLFQRAKTKDREMIWNSNEIIIDVNAVSTDESDPC